MKIPASRGERSEPIAPEDILKLGRKWVVTDIRESRGYNDDGHLMEPIHAASLQPRRGRDPDRRAAARLNIVVRGPRGEREVVVQPASY